MQRLRTELEEEARAAGFAKLGICRPDAIPDAAGRLQEFLSENRHGQMAWMGDRSHWRGDPSALWPAARSVIMLAESHRPEGQRAAFDVSYSFAQTMTL